MHFYGLDRYLFEETEILTSSAVGIFVRGCELCLASLYIVLRLEQSPALTESRMGAFQSITRVLLPPALADPSVSSLPLAVLTATDGAETF